MSELTPDQLKNAGIDLSLLKEFQVIFLPENIGIANRSEDLFDPNDAADLCKMLRARGLKCANSLDLNIKAKTLERRGDELWLGVICVFSSVVMPIFVNVISDYITARLQRKGEKEKEPQQQGKVHLTLKIADTDNIAEFTYSGDGKTLLAMVRGLGRGKRGE